MSSKKVTTNGKKAARAKSEKELFPVRKVDRETERQVIKLVIELHRDTLRELANH